MRIVNIKQGTPEWLAWRNQGITATDAGILLLLDPDKTWWRLWAEKTGRVSPEDLSGNPNVRRGKALEPKAREALESRFDCILLPICVEHQDVRIIRASLDGILTTGQPVEIKCPHENTWKDVLANGDKSEAYLRYQSQVQTQILACGADSGYLAFYFEGHLKVFEIAANPTFHAELVAKAQHFWATHIEGDKEPEKDPLRDIFVPVGQPRGEWLTLATQWKKASAKAAKMKEQLDALTRESKAYEESMIALMGDFMRAECEGVAITRYQQDGQVDWPKLCADLGIDDAVVGKYRKPGSERRRVKEADTTEAEQAARENRKRQHKSAKPDEYVPASVFDW